MIEVTTVTEVAKKLSRCFQREIRPETPLTPPERFFAAYILGVTKKGKNTLAELWEERT